MALLIGTSVPRLAPSRAELLPCGSLMAPRISSLTSPGRAGLLPHRVVRWWSRGCLLVALGQGAPFLSRPSSPAPLEPTYSPSSPSPTPPSPWSSSTRQIDSRHPLRSASSLCSVKASEFWAWVVRMASSVVADLSRPHLPAPPLQWCWSLYPGHPWPRTAFLSMLLPLPLLWSSPCSSLLRRVPRCSPPCSHLLQHLASLSIAQAV